MNLPPSGQLPVHQLAACFNSTSASYKFYWFLSMLHRVESGSQSIAKMQLFADMVAHSWFTINYFKVSFGKQDKLQQASSQIRMIEGLNVDAGWESISARLYASSNSQTLKALWYFNAEVPHRFLSPWFNAGDQKSAYAKSQEFTNDCLYAIDREAIHLNPLWTDYLRQNAGILKAFCLWHLGLYLQARNPSVPDIMGKLVKSPSRKALTAQRKNFWDIVLAETGGVDCIYTNSRLQVGKYAVEHFLPHAFVSHDLMWNLIPADPAFNSAKSDSLPPLERYFKPFFAIQQTAVEIMRTKHPGNRFLLDYLTILPGLEPEFFNDSRMLEHFQPMVSIACNNGFRMLSL